MSMNEPPKDEAQDRLEQHLRGFRPVVPRALRIARRPAPWGVLAVAAVVLLVVAVLWIQKRWQASDGTPIARRSPTVVPGSARVALPVTIRTLNAALRASDQDLGKILDDASSRLLPREHRGTALFELGKEKE
jgi:hypothetical protein